MKNKTLQDDNSKAPIITYGFDFINKSEQGLNPKDYEHLRKKPNKEEQQKYWSKTMMIILIMVILIIYLYHFHK